MQRSDTPDGTSFCVTLDTLDLACATRSKFSAADARGAFSCMTQIFMIGGHDFISNDAFLVVQSCAKEVFVHNSSEDLPAQIDPIDRLMHLTGEEIASRLLCCESSCRSAQPGKVVPGL